MGLVIDRSTPVGGMISDRRLCLTADKSELVEAGDARAAFLLASEEAEIPASEVARLGLSLVGGRVVQGAAEAPEPEPAAVAEEPSDAVEEVREEAPTPKAKGRGRNRAR